MNEEMNKLCMNVSVALISLCIVWVDLELLGTATDQLLINEVHNIEEKARQSWTGSESTVVS